MARIARSVLAGSAVAAAVAGILVAAPASAFAGATGELFTSHHYCEKRAAQIRDGSTGAWCEPEMVWTGVSFVQRWRLFTSDR
ncbi:hypothetical protein [Allokutzneria sp. NRRL B-24872]|uniref:hypothetical protein n=1 Tax=Allokutzneria sp. NRRL B-24872 TaxID=1137961 RepID=UPI0011785E25|nr:hypothetical protein [Allokutzneria sp. NRRL B-24872]